MAEPKSVAEQEDLHEIGGSDLWVCRHLNRHGNLVIETGCGGRAILDRDEIATLIANLQALLAPPLNGGQS